MSKPLRNHLMLFTDTQPPSQKTPVFLSQFFLAQKHAPGCTARVDCPSLATLIIKFPSIYNATSSYPM